MQPGKGFLVWLAGLSVLGFLATDMYLPAFAAIQADLQTPAAAVSASLSLFLAGFAVAQLLCDRYRIVMAVNRFYCWGYLSLHSEVWGCCG